MNLEHLTSIYNAAQADLVDGRWQDRQKEGVRAVVMALHRTIANAALWGWSEAMDPRVEKLDSSGYANWVILGILDNDGGEG